MKFRLAIGDQVDVPVKTTIATSGAKEKAFSFTLEAKRMDVADYIKQMESLTVNEFVVANVTGWRGQRLVLDDNDQPADWSPEAFAVMLGTVGLVGVIFAAYVKALNAAETESGKRGNF